TADPRHVELALLEHPLGVLEDLVDRGPGHLPGAVVVLGLAGLSSVCTARQVSRTRARAIERVSGMPSSRPSGTSSRMPWNRMEASVTGSVSASRAARLAAVAIIEALSSSVIVE